MKIAHAHHVIGGIDKLHSQVDADVDPVQVIDVIHIVGGFRAEGVADLRPRQRLDAQAVHPERGLEQHGHRDIADGELVRILNVGAFLGVKQFGLHDQVAQWAALHQNAHDGAQAGGGVHASICLGDLQLGDIDAAFHSIHVSGFCLRQAQAEQQDGADD